MKLTTKTKNKLKNMGFVVGRPLGSGSFGTAFKIVNYPNYVLKATSDKKEAYSASRLMGKKVENVYRIERVFKFLNGNLFFIICEKLNKVNWNSMNIISFDLKHYGAYKNGIKKLLQIIVENPEKFQQYKNLQTLASQDLEKLNNIILWCCHYSLNFLDDFKKYARGDEQAKKTIEFRLEALDEQAKEAAQNPMSSKLGDLTKGVESLISVGIKKADIHEDNVMQRENGDLVFIDIGSDSQAGSIEQITEQFDIVDVIRKLNDIDSLSKESYYKGLKNILKKADVEYTEQELPVGMLQYNQARVFRSKLNKISKELNDPENIYPIVVDMENQILDGHHRIYVIRSKYGDDQIVPTLRINTIAKELIYERTKN